MKRLILFFLSTALCIGSLFSQFPHTHSYHYDPGASERNRNIDVTHMRVEVSFIPQQNKVIGNVTHTFKMLQSHLDTLFLHAPGIAINSVTLDGVKTDFYSNTEGLVVKNTESPRNMRKTTFEYLSEHTLDISYTATPKRGLYFIGWNLDTIEEPAHMSRRQIWTQGQGIDNRHWIPMIDDRSDKFTTETLITFDKSYQVLSNGELISTKENKKDGTKTWHYSLKKPHAGYLLMLAIDQYAIKKSKSKKGIEHQFWYYPEQPERLEPTSRYSEEILDFLADEIGVPYPWGSYSQVMVQDFLYGAMENTSATVLGDFFWIDQRAYLLNRNYVSVNAHEATHQWFGDYITGRKDNEQWLQESFATFYPGLVEGHLFSNDHQAWYFRNHMNSAIAAGHENSLPVRHSQSGSSRHYPKGASILYMLQHQIGRDNFRRGIQYYLSQYAFKTVETWDLQKAFIDATGINVDAFFDQWIHRGGEPKFRVRYFKNDQEIQFFVDQTHTQDAVVRHFEIPIDIALYYKDGSVKRFTQNLKKTTETFNVASNGDIDFVLFDEGSFVLKEIDFPKTESAWLSQFQKAAFMLDRYDALVALRNTAPEFKRTALIEAFTKETFDFMRGEIASQLLSDSGVPIQIIKSIATDKQAQVRLTFAQNAPILKSTESMFENLLLDSSYVIIETVLDRIFDHPLYAPRQSIILDKINTVDGHTHGIKIKYLEKAQAIYPKMGPGMRKALVNMAGPKYEFRTRTLALQSLHRMNYLDAELAQNLFEAATNFNSRLNGSAWGIINYFATQTQKSQLLKSEVLKWEGGDSKSISLRKKITGM